MLITKQLLLLDPLYALWRSRLGAGCISFTIEAHAQAFRGSAGALAGGFRGPLAARRAGFPRPGAAPRPAAARAPRPWGAHLSLAASGTPIGTPRDGQESPRNHEAGPKEAPKDGRRLPHDGPKRSPREPTVLLPIPCLNAAGAPLGSERIMAGKFRGCVYCTASAAASAGGSFRRGPR